VLVDRASTGQHLPGVHVAIRMNAALPAALIPALLGAGVTLFVTYLVNVANADRQRQQFEHERHERNRERLTQMRRELYSEALGELNKLHLHLLRMPNIDVEQEGLGDGMHSFFLIASKIMLVAEPATVQLVSALSHQYGLFSLQMMDRLVPLAAARADHERAVRIRDAAKEKVEHMGPRVEELSRVHGPSAHEVTSFQRLLQNERSLFTSYKQVALDTEERFAALKQAYDSDVMQMILGNAANQLKLLTALRSDLGIQGDVVALEAMTAAQVAELSGTLDQLMQKYRLSIALPATT
jgi:hypothetical protein